MENDNQMNNAQVNFGPSLHDGAVAHGLNYPAGRVVWRTAGH
jgi:hypothetical protein